MRLCPYCGEDVPVRYPFGFPRFFPWHVMAVTSAVPLIRFLSKDGLADALSVYYRDLFHSAPAVLLMTIGLILLFTPPSIDGPGVPVYPARIRLLREALWRLAFLVTAFFSSALVSLFVSDGAWGMAILSSITPLCLVFSVPFYALPPWGIPVAPLFLLAAFM